MTLMAKMWYDKIIDSVSTAKTDLLFIVDPANLTDFSRARESLGKKFTTIVAYKNELKLRRMLREKNRKTLIIFRDKKDIPFDLLSIHATIEVDTNAMFPLLDKEVLLSHSFDYYQEIYTEYLEFEKDRYDRLSESETSVFIDRILSSETIKEKKKALELIESLNELIKKPLTNCNTCGSVSQAFGELMYLVHGNDLNIDVEKIESDLNTKFIEYVQNYYEDLIYSTNSLINSNMLGIVFGNPDEKNALICFDCMGFEEWNVIKEYLEKRMSKNFDIEYSFSM
ncbi:hypothetical protein CEE45_17840, partial [Candidatus Heimdallarchaeota archaeon B3_Heim]